MKKAFIPPLVALVTTILIHATPAKASTLEPPTAPVPRVETGMHTTLIRRLVVDQPRNRLITCSDDKTVRVWQMPEGRLVSVLRVPIGPGHEGQLFGLAVSPDGKTVAVGGWTGWDWEGAASIYLFDVSTGDIVKRVRGFKHAVGSIAWTADRKHLAIGLHGRGGFHVLRLADNEIVASDPEYNDRIMDIDVARNGRIVTVAMDGMTRLYEPNFKLIGRRIIPGGKKPVTARFSPDASLLVVGHIDTPTITVAYAQNLTLAFQPDISRLKQQTNLSTVTWSSDGEYIYAGGEYAGGDLNPLYRWGTKGRGTMAQIPLANNRITDLQTMSGGRIAFAAEDPGIGVLNANGGRESFRGPDIIDFSHIGNRLQVSQDAVIVRYARDRNGDGLSTYSVLAAGDQNIAAPSQEKLFPPLLETPEFRVENWRDSIDLTINGKKPALEDYELSRAYAIAPDRKSVLIGTEWSLRLLDRNANERWRVKLAAVAWSVNVAPAGKFAVAALSDGTIRWYRMSDGQEVLSYFPHGNGQDWIAWVSNGYYASSVYGDNFIGWHLNRGKDTAPDFFRAVQFDRILFRPDVVAATFRAATEGQPEKPSRQQGEQIEFEVKSGRPQSGKESASTQTSTRTVARDIASKKLVIDLSTLIADFDIGKLQEIIPPRLRLQPMAVDSSNGRTKLTLHLTGEKSNLPIKDYTVFVNNIPITPAQERRLSGGDNERFSRRVEVELFSRANNIRVEAFNGVSMGIAETFVSLPESAPVAQIAGDLYVLAIGVNTFPRLPQRTHLAYAAADAEDLSKSVATHGQALFKKIHARVITDFTQTKPNRSEILSALDFVKQAGAKDTVVIFLASHGISDKIGNYYFVPRDAAPDDIQAVAQGRKAESLLPWTVFFDALRNAAGRRILIVDTCQARNIEGKFELHSLMKHSASSLFSLLVAAKGDEESQEYATGKHGLFTYALISALDSASDTNKDGFVSLREAFDAARPIVDRLREKSIGPQTPQLIAPDPLGDVPLMKASVLSR